MAKFYAVKKGRKTGIFHTWEQCQAQTKGFPGAIFKSFSSLEEANQFLLEIPTVNENKEKINTPTTSISNYAYIDGSFDKVANIYGSGVVIIDDQNTIKHKFGGDDPELAKMRNVTGEIEAAKFVMTYAYKHNIKDFAIYYDYEGIAAWATGNWKTNLPFTKNYALFAKKIMERINIQFIKVAAHTGVALNEEADKLAKLAIADFSIDNNSLDYLDIHNLITSLEEEINNSQTDISFEKLSFF